MRVRELDVVSAEVSPDLGQDVAKLWADDGVQKTWAKKVSSRPRPGVIYAEPRG